MIDGPIVDDDAEARSIVIDILSFLTEHRPGAASAMPVWDPGFALTMVRELAEDRTVRPSVRVTARTLLRRLAG